jgi:phage terminase small subunit
MKEKKRKYRPLTLQQQAFITTLSALYFNVPKACNAVGLAEQTAKTWLKRPDFKAAVERRKQQFAAAADAQITELFGLLMQHSRVDMADILPNVPLVQAAKKAGFSHLIKKVKYQERILRSNDPKIKDIVETRTEVEVVDAQKACALLGKWLNVEHREDDMERARIAVRAAMAMLNLTAEEAIMRMTPHFPAAPKLREEFALAAGPTIEMQSNG